MELKRFVGELRSGFNRVATSVALTALQIPANNTINTTIAMAEQFGRRDFLKLASIGAAATASLSFPENVEGQGIPTSITQTEKKWVDQFTKAAESKGILPEQISAFTIKVGGFSSWDFFVIAPSETTNANGDITLIDERLFVRDIVFNPRGMAQITSVRYVELSKNTNQIAADGKTLVTEWSMVKREPRPDKDQNDTKHERILWYPQLTDEQWKIVAKDKELSEFFGFMGFLPPSTTIGFFSNWGLERETVDYYDPKTNELIKKEAFAYPIDLANDLPDAPKNALIKREKINIIPNAELPVEIKKLQKDLGETNYSFVWNNDLKSIALTYTNPETGETSVIPEIVFDENGNWKRTYTFETPYGTQAEVTIDNRVDKMTVTETPEGKKVLDFSAWRLVDGKWERETEQGETQYNVSEVQHIIINNGSDNPDDRQSGVQIIYDYTNELFPGQVGKYEGTIRYRNYKGVIKSITSNSRWWATDVTTLDNENKRHVTKTTSYVVLNFASNKKSAVIYKDKNRELRILFIDADLNDWGNWSPYF